MALLRTKGNNVTVICLNRVEKLSTTSSHSAKVICNHAVRYAIVKNICEKMSDFNHGMYAVLRHLKIGWIVENTTILKKSDNTSR